MDPEFLPAESPAVRQSRCAEAAPQIRELWREAGLDDHQIIKNCTRELVLTELTGDLEQSLRIHANISLIELQTTGPGSWDL